MEKDKKVTGGFSFINKDETIIATISKNTVYVFSLTTKKQINKFKSLSNISFVAISKDIKKVAVKNTSGIIALLDFETGEELFRNNMYKTEGEQIYFSDDGKYVFDIDWGGRFMLFDCNNGSCILLDNKKILPRNSHIQIDYSNRIIYRFVRTDIGYSSGIIQSYNIDENKLNPEDVNFENINKIKTNSLIDKWNISLCKNCNYYFDGKNIIQTDKRFNIVKEIKIKKEKENDFKLELNNFWVSENENYILVKFGYSGSDIIKMLHNGIKYEEPCLSILYNLRTMEKIKEFNYPYVDNFKMLKDNKTYIISTWNGTYIGEL